MTREDARAYFIDSNERIISVAKDENSYNYKTQQIEDIFMRRTFEANEWAIKALEQKSFMNKPCVANQVWYEDKVKMLDKIRAEIESVIQEETVIVHPEARNGYESVVSKLDPDDVFQIIDKYKTEERDR